MRSQWTGLVGDVGGTNARLALTDGQGHIRNPRTFACKDYASLADIVAEYIETTAGRKRPPRAFARSCATTAEKAWPRCKAPFGLGAKRKTGPAIKRGRRPQSQLPDRPAPGEYVRATASTTRL